MTIALFRLCMELTDGEAKVRVVRLRGSAKLYSLSHRFTSNNGRVLGKGLGQQAVAFMNPRQSASLLAGFFTMRQITDKLPISGRPGARKVEMRSKKPPRADGRVSQLERDEEAVQLRICTDTRQTFPS
jgi:hypothetical protein